MYTVQGLPLPTFKPATMYNLRLRYVLRSIHCCLIKLLHTVVGLSCLFPVISSGSTILIATFRLQYHCCQYIFKAAMWSNSKCVQVISVISLRERFGQLGPISKHCSSNTIKQHQLKKA